MRLLALLLLGSPLSYTNGQGVDLGGGVTTRVDVEKYADLALDIRDVLEFLDDGNIDAAINLYVDGRNAQLQPGIKLSLQDVAHSMAAIPAKDSTPIIIYHLWGLSNRDLAEINTYSQYANNYAISALSAAPDYAADGLVALHLWMYAAHVLFKGVEICGKLTVADNPLAFDLAGGGMDEFIATWIGHEQTPASEDGHGLYAMTQRIGDLFAKNDPEAQVNTNLKLLYQEGAEALSFPDACSKKNPSTYAQLWNVAQRIVSQMYIPLMQLLIDALWAEDLDSIRIYATAIVPQISQCRASLFKRLREDLLGDAVEFSRRPEIIKDLQSAYECLGFSCSDIGTYRVDQLAACTDTPDNMPLAEYVPSTFVNDRAKIDLDILQLEILTKVQAYTFAQALYRYGRNSPIPRDTENDPYMLRSLQDFATSDERDAADPFYSDFVAYSNDPNYANAVIVNTLAGTGKWGTKSSAQRTEMIVQTVSFQVMYMYVLAEMADAHADCLAKDANDNAGGAHAWDEVAAYLIGSLEGSERGGSSDEEDGRLLWNLADKRAFKFQTINSDGYSLINSELLDLLYAGRGELDAYDCDNLSKTIQRIQHLILLPIVQSSILYASLNQGLADTSTTGGLADGEAFALAILPVISKYDKDAAEVIEENLVFRDGVSPSQDGPQVIADAFFQALDEFGYSCALVGAISDADACHLAGGFAKVKETYTSTSTGGRTSTSSPHSHSFVASSVIVICGLIYNLL